MSFCKLLFFISMIILLNVQKYSNSLTQHRRTRNLNASVHILSINRYIRSDCEIRQNIWSQLREWVHLIDITYNSICWYWYIRKEPSLLLIGKFQTKLLLRSLLEIPNYSTWLHLKKQCIISLDVLYALLIKTVCNHLNFATKLNI